MASHPLIHSFFYILHCKLLEILDAESGEDALMCMMFYAFIILCLTFFVKIVGNFVHMLFSTVF